VAVHDERHRLARELHDGRRTNPVWHHARCVRVLTLLERSETEQVHTVVDQMLRLVNDSQTELRRLYMSCDRTSRITCREDLLKRW